MYDPAKAIDLMIGDAFTEADYVWRFSDELDDPSKYIYKLHIVALINAISHLSI
jgi:hypothetical protein